MNGNDVKILAEEMLYNGFLKIKRYQLQHKLFAGGWSETISRELLVRERVAAALLYDPALDKVVLLEQFRIGALRNAHGPWLVEIVAGLAGENEEIEDVVRREAEEEAGLIVKALMPICDYWVSPGGSAERVALYCAQVDASQAGGIFGLPEEHEDIRVTVETAETAFAMVADGRINNAATIIALQWLQLNKARVQASWNKK